MTDFDFGPLDAVEPPDQWADILRRSERPAEAVALPPRRWLLTAAAVVAAVAAVAGLVTVVTSGSDRADRPVGAGTDPAAGGEPGMISCLEGGLAPGGVPDSAVAEPSLSAQDVQPGQQALSWTADGLELELLVPAIQYIDFVGERTENTGSPKGMLWFRDGQTRFLGRTGLGGTCGGYELTVAGGDEDRRVEVLTTVARGLEWDESRGITDCGPLSAPALQIINGTTPMDAITHVWLAGVTGLILEPIPDDWWWPVAPVLLPDGRCQIPASIPGTDLRVQVTVSGDDGRYAIDRIIGFPPDEDPMGTWSGRRSGVNISVDLDFWCADCAEATLTISYPEQDMTESVTIHEQGTFVLQLPEPPPPDPSGLQVIVYRTASGDVRGVFGDVEPAFILDSSP